MGQVLYEYERISEDSEPDTPLESPETTASAESIEQDSFPKATTLSSSAPSEQTQESSERNPSLKKLMTPNIRALLKKHNISPESLEGTGRDGRILKEDVEAFLASPRGSQPRAAPKLRFTPQTKEEVDPRAVLPTKPIPRPPTLNELTKINPNRDSKTLKNIDVIPQTEETPIRETLVRQDQFTGEKQTVKMTNFEKGMQKSMTAANSVPQFFFHDEYDFTVLVLFKFMLFKRGPIGNNRRKLEKELTWEEVPNSA